MSPRHVEVHVTTPDAATAERIAHRLVEERLAACVQVVPGVVSTYRWEGTVEIATEHLLLVKTAAERFDAVRRAVRAEHPYDTPEVLAVPVVAVDDRYAAWLDESVGQTRPTGPVGPTVATRSLRPTAPTRPVGSPGRHDPGRTS
ncbi:MAG: divalent-cation tolerance protein CutA [Phycicoccus sp.]